MTNGIDVSKWQGQIDWSQVCDAGYEWVAIRTWDRQTNAVDETFARNRDGMGFARWKLLYYWLEPGRVAEGVDEFFDSIGELRPGEGAMLDAEEEGITVDECIEWCEAVEARTGLPCAVYTGGYTADGTIWHSDELFDGRRARIFAAYTDEDDAHGHADGIAWDAWQYSCTGTVPGVDADCDLDRIDNTAAFDRCLAGGQQPTSPPAEVMMDTSLPPNGYYTDMADLFRAAGLTVVEYSGWKSRARSSGGFKARPLGNQWHHTASDTEPENDASWQAEGSDDAPIGNCTIMRDGSIWMIAAGAANTAGKGGPLGMSRGTVPLDSGNSTTWAFEVANNGVGEAWPQVQIDAYFTASNVANQRFGNVPNDLFTHHLWAPDRKIDPATAAAVQGSWKPRSINSSGTWNVDDIRNEAKRRADSEPEDEEVTQDDINKIAKAVWAYMTTDLTVNKPVSAEYLLQCTRGAACNADRQTRKGDALNSIAEEVWGFKINDPTGSPQPKMVPANVLMGYIRGAACNADIATRAGSKRFTELVWEVPPSRTLTD